MRKRKLDIPGPFQFPFIGNLIQAQANIHRLPEFCYECCKKYGLTWHFVIPGGQTIVVAADPACAEYILKTNFENYEKGDHFKDVLKDLLGDGIFNADGSLWKTQRQVASHLFKVKELRDMVPVFHSHAQHVLERLESVCDTGKGIDVSDLFFKFTLDSIGEIAFGYNIDSIHSDAPFARAFDKSQEYALQGFMTPKFLWKLIQRVSPDAKEQMKVINDFAYKLLKERKQDPELHSRKDLLSRYMVMEDQEFSDSYLRDIIMNFSIAGRDTTAQTLSWTFYLLALNPEKQKPLLEEIQSVISNGNVPDYDALKDMKYTKGVINESLRLFPPVPVDLKVAVKDDVLPNGYKIPAGTSVAWTAWGMGRLEQFWNKPEEFMPERWLDAEENKKRHPFLFIPFQAGPRTCLGQNMAYMETKMLLSLILAKYELRLTPDQLITYKKALTLPPASGIMMTVHRR